ncbi:discoidin domain-containing protein [Paenibacillus sp. GSMTC-2017]|uniref:basic secretory protein-like protein n=1 Tax=Paenibacillus sp. GSMTC-2017 TaxID=2794350 RepID=UPI0018D64241|nr:basic secretory protein-like protein [Paenibacillus sp. GSMTC-2017]MBH5316214.1 discoidin domain-containing protein [Paenibacillus sp. GSMTC-2017]
MRKLCVFILAVAIGLGVTSTTNLQTAVAAESTTITVPLNLAVGGTVTASGGYGSHQDWNKAFDKHIFSKWLTFENPAWIQYELTTAKVITSYSITSGDDVPERDPKGWVVKGSNDGTTWTTLDTQQNQSFSTRLQEKTYSIANTTAFKFVAFENITNQNAGTPILQISEIKLFGNEVQTYRTIKPTVTASGENAPTDVKANLVDGSSTSKWLTYNNTAWLQFDYGEPVTIDGYALTSAKSYNNTADADPKSWLLQGSNDNTNWTTIDTRSNEKFKFRHQRKHYILNNNTTAYRYYKLSNIQNNSGYAIQLSEVEFSRTNDMWHEENPIIEIQNIAGFTPFDQALPNAEQEILAIIRKVNELFYNNPTEMAVRMKKIAVQIVDQPGGAWISGDADLKTIGFSSQYLASYVSNPNNSLREEIIGILYHELGHAYQLSNFDTEAVADSLRFATGYHNRYGISQGGAWHNTHTANFIRWIDDTKHRGFIRAINGINQVPHGLDANQTLAWKESQIQSITGINVNTLWTQYQQSLVN